MNETPGLSKKRLKEYLGHTQLHLGGIYDVITRRLGFLYNQEEHGRAAASVIHQTSDRTRRPYRTFAERQVLPLIQAESLKSKVKRVAQLEGNNKNRSGGGSALLTPARGSHEGAHGSEEPGGRRQKRTNGKKPNKGKRRNSKSRTPSKSSERKSVPDKEVREYSTIPEGQKAD